MVMGIRLFVRKEETSVSPNQVNDSIQMFSFIKNKTENGNFSYMNKIFGSLLILFGLVVYTKIIQ